VGCCAHSPQWYVLLTYKTIFRAYVDVYSRYSYCLWGRFTHALIHPCFGCQTLPSALVHPCFGCQTLPSALVHPCFNARRTPDPSLPPFALVSMPTHQRRQQQRPSPSFTSVQHSTVMTNNATTTTAAGDSDDKQ